MVGCCASMCACRFESAVLVCEPVHEIFVYMATAAHVLCLLVEW